MDVLSTPSVLTLEAAVTTDANAFQFRCRYIHLDVVRVAVEVNVRVVIQLQIDRQHVAVKFGDQVVQSRTVAFHLDVVVPLCVDDVHATEIRDVVEFKGGGDAFPDDVLLSCFLFLRLLRIGLRLIACIGLSACSQQQQGSECDDKSVFHVLFFLFVKCDQ